MGWYDCRWANRKLITLTGTADGAQTNYQLKLTVYKSVGTDSGAAVYLGTKVQDDFDDLIFTKSDGITTLDYWVESVVSGTSAVVWVEFNSIPASPSTATFYLYYNNGGASAASNGANTFIFFDHFDGTFPGSLWTGDTTYGSVASSILTYTSTSGEKYIQGTVTQAQPCALRSRAQFPTRTANTAYNTLGLRKSDNSANFIDIIVSGTTTTYNKRRAYATTGTEVGSTIGLSAYHIYDLLYVVNSYTAKEDGVNLSGTNPITTKVPTSAVDVNIYGNRSTANATIYLDWVLIRNYTANEPAWTSWGVEERPSDFLQLF